MVPTNTNIQNLYTSATSSNARYFYIPTSPLLNIPPPNFSHLINYNINHHKLQSVTTSKYGIVNKLSDIKKNNNDNKSDLPAWKRLAKKLREQQYYRDIVLVL